MEVYAVTWGTSSCDDHGSANAFSGVHGIYKSEASAKAGLEECKQEMLEEVFNNLDPDDAFPNIREEVKVYGSVKDGYFEIDYVLGTEPIEIYIGITHSYVQD